MPNYTEQLKRDGNLLARPTPTKRPKGRIPHMSKKREGERAIYKKMLPGWLRAHPTCEIGPVFHAAGIPVKCLRRTTHAHHVKGRIGKILHDEKHMLASCSGECHPQAVHRTHVKEARKLGLLA